MTVKKPPSRPADKASSQDKPAKRRGPDWEAIRRDYRTDKFSLRELAAKHDTDASTILRCIKRDTEKDPDAWPKDLRRVVRQATNAKLMAQLVNTEVSAGQHEVNTVVLAVAEVNKQIILGHRDDLRRLRQLALGLMEEVAAARVTDEQFSLLTEIMAGENADAIDLKAARGAVARMTERGDRVRDAKALAEIIDRVRKGEREAFGLDDGEDKPPPPPLHDMPPGSEIEAYRAWVNG